MELMNPLDKKFKKKQPIIIALFKDHSTLEKTIQELNKNGFQKDNISILMAKPEDFQEHHLNRMAREAATTGLVTGITTGGILGLLASLDSFIIPSVGIFLASGPLAIALAGIAIGGTVGSIGAAFISFGISKFESKNLEKYIKDKGVIIALHAEKLKEQLIAKNIFVANNAVKIFNPLHNKNIKELRS